MADFAVHLSKLLRIGFQTDPKYENWDGWSILEPWKE